MKNNPYIFVKHRVINAEIISTSFDIEDFDASVKLLLQGPLAYDLASCLSVI